MKNRLAEDFQSVGISWLCNNDGSTPKTHYHHCHTMTAYINTFVPVKS